MPAGGSRSTNGAGDRGLFPYDKGDGSIIKPQTVIETLCEVTKGDAFVTSDVGQHQMFAAQYYKFNKPNRWINSGGAGHHGLRFPAAMGVKLSFPDADVACVTREGSIQDEHPGVVDLPAVRPAGEDRQPEQRCARHGSPMAGT